MQENISRATLVKYIVDEIRKGTDNSTIAHRVAGYLISSGQTHELNSVMRDAQELRALRDGLVELTVRSAHDLDRRQLDSIAELAKSLYKGSQNVVAHQVNDEKVIGGASIQLPHANLDLTVRARLNKLRESVS